MHRRSFLSLPFASAALAQVPRPVDPFDAHRPLLIERPLAGKPHAGKPHAGKTLALIQPHSDDIPIFAAGTAFKLIEEGFKAYPNRVTSDDMAGFLFRMLRIDTLICAAGQ